MPIDRCLIRVKAMLIAPNEELSAHAVSLNKPTPENPDGYHRLIGGSVEYGESHLDAIVREVHEELRATVHGVTYLPAVWRTSSG
jgi:NADH pyrophosphatase NudC (nudix superfamily)